MEHTSCKLLFSGVYPGHEPAKFCDDPLKTYQFDCFLNHFYDSAL